MTLEELLTQINTQLVEVYGMTKDPVKHEQYYRAYRAFSRIPNLLGEGGTGTLKLIWWYQNIHKPKSKENRKKVITDAINAHLSNPKNL